MPKYPFPSGYDNEFDLSDALAVEQKRDSIVWFGLLVLSVVVIGLVLSFV